MHFEFESTYANKYLAQAKTIFLAASWDWQIKSSVFQKALKNFFKEQSIAGKKIYVMEQVPKLNRNPQRHLRFFGLGLRPEMRIDSSYSFANEWLKQIALEFPAVTTLNFENTGLFKGAPLYQNQLIYLDEHHINEIGAEYYSAMASTSSTLESILRQLP